MNYRGYYITQSSWGGFDFWPGGENDYYYDGEHDNAKHANSIEDAKAQIAQIITTSCWLTYALSVLLN